MRPNLINRLKEEWNSLDPVDPLRGLIADAIDALAEQPAQPSKPLTDAQIGAVAADIWGSVLIAPQSYQAFARAIEAAHGIKE